MADVVRNIMCAQCGVVLPQAQTKVGPGGLRLCPSCHTRQPSGGAVAVQGNVPDFIPIEAPDLSGRTRAPCPRCGESLVVGVPTCATCGYDPTAIPLEPSRAEEVLGPLDPDAAEHPRPRAKRKEPPKAPLRKCNACGYNLTSLPPDKQGDVVCPECGCVHHGWIRPDSDEETARYVRRMTYLQPTLMLCIGLAVYFLVLLAQGWWQGGVAGSLKGPIKAPADSGWKVALLSLGAGLAFYFVASALSIGMTFVLGLLWTGLNTSMRILTLQVAGLLASVLALYFLLAAIPLPIPWWLIGTLCGLLYSWYLSEMQEIELYEAAGVTLASMLATGGFWWGIQQMV